VEEGLIGWLLLASCLSTPPDRPELLSSCSIVNIDADTQCGTIHVPENPADPNGRSIGLNVLVVPAVSSKPRPDPVFFLAGGPGQAATRVAADMMRVLRTARAHRDIVFVDQRGTGDSNRLHCEEESDTLLGEPLMGEDEAKALQDCLDGLDADPRFYTSHLAIDDFDHVRKVLGYESVNLIGASYGTRAALTWARRHPRRVRTMVLDGVAPPDMELFLHFPVDGQAAMDALIRDCAEQPACHEAFGDLGQTLETVLASEGQVRIKHPRTGAPHVVTLTRSTLASAIRGVLYVPMYTSVLPYALHQASTGDWEPLLALTSSFATSLGDTMSGGLMLSVACAEDIPRLDPHTRKEALRGSFLGDETTSYIAQSCDVWPTGEVPPDHAAPVHSDIPTLLLSGSLDPVTPPRWADHAAKTLTRSTHVVAPGAGHGVIGQGCTSRRVSDFLEAGTAEGIDFSCITEIKRAPLFIDFAGPGE
jgi:pimeloyl-ACP methyl ester carboxylesterase